MAHIHSVYDSDGHFLIDGKTRNIKSATGKKKTIVQYDHNSERLTFELPRIIEGHDMTTCDVVEIHYLNIDPRTGDIKKGVYEVQDLQVSEEDENMATFSWLISRNATQYAGPLQFLATFKCCSEGEEEYSWSTHIYKQFCVTRGIDNGEAVVEEYADILAQWREVFLGNATEEELAQALDKALERAKESGAFDGADGQPGKDGSPGKDGYTPVKGVDYFDGQPGKDGADGKDGSPGKDGYTPVKGVDYFDGQPGKDGKDGSPGADGYTPVKGKDYFDGEPGKDGSNGKDGSDGVSATHSWNGTVLTVTSASGTSSADLKGATGSPGKDGSNGQPGADGVSPTVAVSKSGKVTTVSITDKNGTKTATVNDGADGSSGSNGKDGTSVTVKSVSESTADGGSNVVTFSDGKTVTIKNGSKGSSGSNGSNGADGVSISSVKQTTTSTADGGSNVVTVTLSNGTTSTFTVKNGSKGSTGATGAAGKTPVKGTDYWSAADKEEMIQDVISALGGSPIFGVVDVNNNIVLSGNLADGTYTIKYEDTDGKVTEIGTLKQSSVTYTNLFVASTANLNQRMSGSSKAPKSENGYVMTAAIMLPTAFNMTGSSKEHFIAVPSGMWANSANVFMGNSAGDTQGYNDVAGAGATVVGNWAKIPLFNKWGNSNTCDRVIVSLYVKGSAITASDIQNIEIYFDEIPE